MKKYKRLGIYGGTFAPVHKGHMQAASVFLNSSLIDHLLIMPSFIPPHKSLSFADSPSARLDMLRIAFGTLKEYGKSLEISDYEIAKGDVSYTYETAMHFLPLCDKLILLCGSDMLLSFDTWYRAEELMKICELAYIPRHKDDISALRSKSAEFHERFGLVSYELSCDIIDISSSEIREMICANRDITEFTHENVAKYIKENGLYV